MVFKKPYGFLIRKFKLIHLILLFLYIYLVIKVSNILSFYNNFINGVAGKIDAIKYVNNSYLIAIWLSIFISIVIYLLMRYKKKPRLLYIVLIGLYLLVYIMINVSYGGLQTIYISVIDTKTLILYRDLLRILIIFQYVSIGLVLVRALGFDIKKFNFVQDLQELNIDVSDEEEVELSIGSSNTLRRNAHRGLREFKYYYFENKAFINIILVAIVIVLLGSFFINREFINKEYKQGEDFSSDKFYFNVADSFITNKDYNNSIINVDETSYVVVKMNIASKEGKATFNKANLILKIGNNSYTADVTSAPRFADLGTVYVGQEINGGVAYLFIYNISNADENKKMKLLYSDSIVVNLSPVYLDKNSNSDSYKLGENIDLSNSSFGYGHFKVSKYEIKDEFSYSYDYVINDKSYSSSLKISSDQSSILHLVIDSEYLSGFSNYDILSKYAKLKYKVNDIEYISSSFSDKTPGTYVDGVYLAVDSKIKDASNIWLEFNIRNNQYRYVLK